MDLSYDAKRLIDVARALRLARAAAERERWPRERLVRHQQEAVDAIVRHAVARSPFYRERFAGLVGAEPVTLSALPGLDKATMMERFDDVVCDRRLRRDALLEHLDGLDHDALYLGEHRVMTTSGSSGRKGLFVYDRRGWATIGSQFFRLHGIAGIRPRIPRLRIAVIGGGSPTHMSRRGAATVDVGVHRVCALAVTMPLERIVAALNDFQPDYVNAYPSMAALLADEQRAGRLRIAPSVMSTSSEMRTPELTERIEQAFGVRPYNLYATTEGLWGASCGHGDGIHLFEDLTVVENVDADGAAVPPGEPGARILVTTLFNRVQPLIRFAVDDVMTLDPEPCPCGRTLVRVRAVSGRADDVLHLPGGNARLVAVHPLQFAVVTADRDVREFQVVQEGERLRLRVALRDGASAPDAAGRLRARVADRLADLGVSQPRVEVETCESLPRSAGGKLRMVIADGV
jgi:phenylacetate-CoA ligase